MHDTFSGWLVGWMQSPSSGARYHRASRACVRCRVWLAVPASGLAAAQPPLAPPCRAAAAAAYLAPRCDEATAGAITSSLRPRTAALPHVGYPSYARAIASP